MKIKLNRYVRDLRYNSFTDYENFSEIKENMSMAFCQEVKKNKLFVVVLKDEILVYTIPKVKLKNIPIQPEVLK